MIDELRPIVYTKGSGVSGLTGGFFWVRASQEASDKYAVASIITIPKPDRDTATIYEKIYLQISVYAIDLEDCETLGESMKDEFDDSESDFTLASYNMQRIERFAYRGPRDLEDKFQIILEYEIDLTEK